MPYYRVFTYKCQLLLKNYTSKIAIVYKIAKIIEYREKVRKWKYLKN